MSLLDDLATLVTAAPVHKGYAATGALPPYVVLRPVAMLPEPGTLDGRTPAWDSSFGAYCVGGSVEASYNLALLVMSQLDGKRAGGTALATSLGYVGAEVEGSYETQVTAQLKLGGI